MEPLIPAQEPRHHPLQRPRPDHRRARRQRVPYGFERVLARLAEIGYKEIEFAGYNQSTEILGRQITPAEIRKILDDNGLVANGTHASIKPAHLPAAAGHRRGTRHEEHRHRQRPDQQRVQGRVGRRRRHLERAGPAGQGAGCGSTPTTTTPRTSSCSTRARCDAHGRQTRSSGIRRLEYFFENTDPRYVFFELRHLLGLRGPVQAQEVRQPGRPGERLDLFDPILNVARRGPSGSRCSTPRTATGTPALPNGYEMTPLGRGRHQLPAVLPDHRRAELPPRQLGDGHRPRRRAGQQGPVAGLRRRSATATCRPDHLRGE